MAEQGGDKGFTVVDRRGEESEQKDQPEAPPSAEQASQESPKNPLPTIDFATFTLSLSTSALYHMGLVEDPETGQRAEPNPPFARQTIDTLEMLQAKTRGNLDSEEEHLLESLLYELRLRFVEITKG